MPNQVVKGIMATEQKPPRAEEECYLARFRAASANAAAIAGTALTPYRAPITKSLCSTISTGCV
jgi:hypothetical protein